MKITFNVDYVIGRLGGIASVVNQKNVITALENFMCVAREDNRLLTVVASDGETWIGSTIQMESIDCEDDVKSFCVNAKDFVSTLKNLSGLRVSIDVDSKLKVATGDYGNGKFKLPIFDVANYPYPTSVSDATMDIVLDAHVIADMIAKTRNFVGNMTTMPQFNGIHFDLSESSVTAVATDGYRMVRVKEAYSKYNGEPSGFTISQKAASLAMSIMQQSDDGEYVHIICNGSNSTFSIGGWKMTTRLIESKYPNYERILCTDGYFNVIADTKGLCLAVKRVLGLGDAKSELIVFTIESDSMTVSSENIDFSTSAEETVNCKSEFESSTQFRVGLSGGAIMQLLQNIHTDNVCIKLLNSSRAAMFFNDDDVNGESYASLLLPMQFNQ